MKMCSYFLIIVILNNIVFLMNAQKNDTGFVPTKEWKKVEKGTSIQAGLHVRHNLKTGVTEAKLIDESEKDNESKDDKDTKLMLHPEKAELQNDITNDAENDKAKDSKINIPLDELKSMLKKIKTEESLKNKKIESEIKKKFKTYSELKEDLEILNLNVSSDSEVLGNLFSQFESYQETLSTENIETSKVDDILEILNNMEFLIHKIDNAKVFADIGGMSKVISPALNATDTKIKAEALKLLGSAVQSNPPVQLKALENDFVKKLLHMLTINNKVEVKSRCLFALGALVRNFPVAQKALINHGGLEIFGKILSNEAVQIQSRVMNLINDLTIERKNLKMIQDEQVRIKRKKEYDSINFEEKLSSQKYCQNLIDLMIKSMKSNSEIDDFNEIVYESLITLSSICKSAVLSQQSTLLLEVEKKIKSYLDLPKYNEYGENLYGNLIILLQKLQIIIKIIKEPSHDEL